MYLSHRGGKTVQHASGIQAKPPTKGVETDNVDECFVNENVVN